MARIGQRVTAHGTNLHAAAAADAKTTVTVNGFPATVEPTDVQADHVTFTIPPPTAGTYPTDRPVGIALTTVAGATAVKPDGVTVHEDQITLTGAHPKTVKPGDEFTIIGSGLFDAADLTPAGTPVKDAKGPIITLNAGAGAVECSYPNGAPSPSDNNSHIAVTVPANTAAGNYNVTVQRNGLTAPRPGEPQVPIEIRP